MKVLVVDRDEMALQMIKSKLEAQYHQVVGETSKNAAIDRLANEHFDIIFIDPAPLTSARPVILNIRRSVPNYPYIFLTSETFSQEEAIKAGCNDLVKKPINSDEFEKQMENAESFSELVARIGDDSEDFPSAGGVIAKSAFNQLFLSAIDRADRYGEQTYALFISMSNYKNILEMDGPYAAEYAVAKLSQYLVRLRRQSDIIGQTAKYEYALLLQRPLYESEPIEAANRFAEAISKYEGVFINGKEQPEITVTLVEIPVGRKVVEHIISPEDFAQASSA
ncbi:MAG: response regulator [Micavibrio sp.]|nr:response regulator [Micavibrio sp.]|tara:strand:- start:22555 stop:23394 length:840 start_codon:yes stop_codon:yes gene_type:complete